MSDESLQRIAQVEEAHHGTAEQTIKPGDVVRFNDTWLNDSVVGVAAVVEGGECWTTFVFAEERYGLVLLGIIESKARHLTRLGTADPDALRAATLYAAARGTGFDPDPQRQAARDIALRRGWRELEREDVRTVPHCIDVFVGDEKIGRVQRVYDGPEWTADHRENPPGTILLTLPHLDAALDGLIAQENARRAKERSDG